MSILPALGVAALALGIMSIAPSAVSADTTTVPVGDTWYCSSANQGGVCETTVIAGDTVVWDFSGAFLPHTTTACGSSCDSPSASPLWNSGVLSGGTFSYTFSEPGTYLYYCQVHPDVQRGRIVVRAAGEPTQPPAGTPSPNATPSHGGGGSLPPAGTGAYDSSTGTDRWVALAAGLAIGGGALLYLGAKRRAR